MCPPGGNHACNFLCHNNNVLPCLTMKVVAVKSLVVISVPMASNIQAR
jgi:hypothetical protein